MGCGRSGTTIMGFVLGNGQNCLDLGEVTDFLKRNGKPNGFGPETENGRFWSSVTKGIADDAGHVFDDGIKNKLTAIERHNYFIPLYLGIANKKTIETYQHYTTCLYKKIETEAAQYTCFIDSSKYPGRAYLLATLLTNFDIRIIHLVRHPVKVIESLGDKSKKQGYKGFFSANLYYFLINLFCFLVKFQCGDARYTKIRYEDLLTNPTKCLDLLAHRLNINLNESKRIISENKPFKTGFIFNGNRMRMKKYIILNRNYNNPSFSLKNLFTLFINKIWY